MENYWNTLINCEISLDLRCVVCEADRAKTFSITDTKLYIPVETLSTRDKAKLLKLVFKRTINWEKYQSEVLVQEPNRYLDDLIDPSFQIK